MAPVETPSYLAMLFASEAPARRGIERRQLGMLPLPDGRVFACDPMEPSQKSALDRRVGPGPHRVDVFAVGQDLVAAVLVIGDGSPVRWVLAEAEDPAKNVDAAAGIDVETGTLCLAGCDAAELLFRQEGDGDAAMQVRDRGDNEGIVDVADDCPMAVFITGGDGGYHAWWGEDPAGSTCVLVLGICDPAILMPASPRNTAPTRKPWWKFWTG